MIARPPRPDHGVALVIVLIFLVLLTVLIVGFFMSVQGELIASKNYQNAVAVRQLVSSANNLVAGQLVDGTRSTKTRRPPATAGNIPPGERIAWASQPGLIRTWDERGLGWKIFKLYSSRDMVVDFDRGNRFSVTEKLATEVPASWPAQPAIFTDLNEPVLIEDPRGGIARGEARFRAAYPIVDPLAMAVDKVEGFLITTPPGYGGTFENGMPKVDATTDPTAPLGEKVTANPVPMPVVWIYVLADGTLTVPNAMLAGGRTAVWEKLPESLTPSRENPIVGRLAFWTDDETCKLNINTASEPTPWDTPRAMTHTDLNYGKFQPARKEYQRFPGHPFTTALSPALLPGVDLNSAIKEEIYRLIPRVGNGGTVGATVPLGTTPNPVVLDEHRLFANPDELLFEPRLDPGAPEQRLALFRDTTDLPILRERLTPDRLRRARFFLTSSSRAPETNLFGAPRLSLWPVHANVARRTPFDRLAAFCSTVADTTGSSATSTRTFYFQRRDATSPRADITIQRNRDLFSYLQHLTGKPVPGFGGSFFGKWGNDRDQILTEIFDYIRCTNLRDPLTGATAYAPNGQVAPIEIAVSGGRTARGFGRFHTIGQVGLHFICSRDKDLDTPASGIPLGGLDDGTPLVNAGDRRIQAAFVVEPFSPSAGWPPLEEDMAIEVEFGAFRIAGQTLAFPSTGAALVNSIGQGAFNEGRNRGGSGGIRATLAGLRIPGPPARYPWIAPRVTVPGRAGTMAFDGGAPGAPAKATIRIYCSRTPSPATLVQSIDVEFPATALPVPDLVRTGTTPARNAPATAREDWWDLQRRYDGLRSTPYLPAPADYNPGARTWPSDTAGHPPGFKRGSPFRREDVVRSLVPIHGDLRLIAAQKNVPAADWVPASDDTGAPWNDGSTRLVHLFSEPGGTHLTYGFLNEPAASALGPGLALVSNTGLPQQLTPAEYHYARLPQIRPGAGARFNRFGDFDNGPAQMVDGAYINKPDEGNLSGPEGYPYWSWRFDAPTESFFSPNRLMPSAVMLGSLPTGVARTAGGTPTPWETLLFRPDPTHPGAKSPADHLLLDLFWMPVIEPYAISEPFSTAGKVNLNFEIAPFSYIKRATAMVGVLKAEEPLAIPTNALPNAPHGASKIYKLWDAEVADEGLLPDSTGTDLQVQQNWSAAFKGDAPFDKMRKRIDPVKTLAPFELKFASGEIFRSASQICEMHLPRRGTLADGVTPELPIQYAAGTFWKDHVVTGDNTRERPYANLYGRLTTRSNTFTVHVRAQVLKQGGPQTGGKWNEWREDRDKVAAEHRGSTVLERYIDPADPTLVDFARQRESTVDNAYRLRVVTSKKFNP